MTSPPRFRDRWNVIVADDSRGRDRERNPSRSRRRRPRRRKTTWPPLRRDRRVLHGGRVGCISVQGPPGSRNEVRGRAGGARRRTSTFRRKRRRRPRPARLRPATKAPSLVAWNGSWRRSRRIGPEAYRRRFPLLVGGRGSARAGVPHGRRRRARKTKTKTRVRGDARHRGRRRREYQSADANRAWTSTLHRRRRPADRLSRRCREALDRHLRVA